MHYQTLLLIYFWLRLTSQEHSIGQMVIFFGLTVGGRPQAPLCTLSLFLVQTQTGTIAEPRAFRKLAG
jgi:hypothetical protein